MNKTDDCQLYNRIFFHSSFEKIHFNHESGTHLEDGRTLNNSYQWLLPVNLNEVVAVAALFLCQKARKEQPTMTKPREKAREELQAVEASTRKQEIDRQCHIKFYKYKVKKS